MSFEIVTIPCLEDNYAFLLASRGNAAVVDVPEAAPILSEIVARGLTVTDILLTHHHADHVQGLDELKAGIGGEVRVVGAAADMQRLPPLDLAVADGDRFELLGAEATALDVSGHTVGHIAFHVPAAQVAFTADSLMALGCGRVFEGTMEQMWASLCKIAELPGDTTICSGHEYTESNGRFAITIEPDSPALQERIARITEARSKGEPTVPSLLSEELATNPFLRSGIAEIKSGLGMSGASDAEVFGEIRRRKDAF
ncbi:MAG: hydroxyacylglutathione hydrolase [Boseongicola sp.]|nr:hydroxyacylglutathione hydrolase [Boseongicola sp.]